MSSSFQDKVALVTGASSGIGEATAIMFASRGAKVTLCGRNEGRLMSVFDQAIKVNGGHRDKVLIVVGDVTLPNVRQDMVTKTVDKFGRLDILVANAAVAPANNDLYGATEESFNKTMDTNVKSVFFLIQQAVPHLEKTKGSIVIVSSIGSTLVFPPNLVYPMTKAAVDHLARCLSVELGPKGVRINTVNPGLIPTRVFRDFSAEFLKRLIEKECPLFPLENRLATTEELAEAITFLASDKASFITGQNLKVDGGRSFMGQCAPDLV